MFLFIFYLYRQIGQQPKTQSIFLTWWFIFNLIYLNIWHDINYIFYFQDILFFNNHTDRIVNSNWFWLRIGFACFARSVNSNILRAMMAQPRMIIIINASFSRYIVYCRCVDPLWYCLRASRYPIGACNARQNQMYVNN